MTAGLWPLLAAAVGLGMIALASAADAVLAVTGRVSLRDLANGSPWRDKAMGRLLTNSIRTWATLVLLNSFGFLLVGAGIALAIEGLAADIPGAVALGIGVTAAVLAVAVAFVAPRALALRHADVAAYVVGYPIHVAASVLLPAVAPLARLARRVSRNGTNDLAGGAAGLRGNDVRHLMDGDEDATMLEDDEREMIAGIFELGETKVREVMVPRIDVVAIPMGADLEEALDTIIECGHSRIPVYTDSIDEIVGVLYAKDLLKAFRRRDFEPDLKAMLREAYFVPESKPVDELLGELQAGKAHMAMVVDEYGGTAGLVTIEDLLEEIVGEIQDEYDEDEHRIELESDDVGVFHAGVDIDDVNRLMHIGLPTHEVDTLAGLVFAQLGKVPEVGETADFPDAEIEVMSLEGRRISQVRVTRRPGADGTENGSDGEGRTSESRP